MTYEAEAPSFDREAVYRRLAADPEFMIKFTVLSIAKQHNLYGQVDNYMRKFGKVCVEVADGGDIAKKLESVLNAEVAVVDPKKCTRSFVPTKTSDAPLQDYQTVDPLLLAQPQFRYLPAGLKIEMIEDYHRQVRELEKTKEARTKLINAEKDGSQKKLMRSPKELIAMVAHLDADPKTTKSYGKFANFWWMDRMKKIGGAVDGLVGKIANENLGYDGLDSSNMEQVFDPFRSGVGSVEKQL